MSYDHGGAAAAGWRKAPGQRRYVTEKPRLLEGQFVDTEAIKVMAGVVQGKREIRARLSEHCPMPGALRVRLSI